MTTEPTDMIPLPPPENSSRISLEKAALIISELERLAIYCRRPEMEKAKLREWYSGYVNDIWLFSITDIRNGCIRWRQSGEAFFPTPGQLMKAIRDGIDRSSAALIDGRPTPNGQRQPWGGACRCDLCRDKTPNPGFYRASPEEYADSNRLERDLKYRDEMRLQPSKLDDDEMRLRNQMINDLVMSNGMNRETARMKVMLERTKILYPDNRFAQKAAFSEKEGVVMTPALFAREEMLAAERLATLERRLHERHN